MISVVCASDTDADYSTKPFLLTSQPAAEGHWLTVPTYCHSLARNFTRSMTVP